MNVIGILVTFGVILLVLGVIGILADLLRDREPNAESAGRERAEASIGSTAIKVMGQPALVFGICCLALAFAAQQVQPRKAEQFVRAAVEDYPAGGPGAALVTIPQGQAVQLFGGAVTMKFQSGPWVSGAQLSRERAGPFDKTTIVRAPGEQCFMQLNDGRKYLIDVLSCDHVGTAVLSLHAVQSSEH